ncbi:MAG: hypothetical protein RLY59_353, partial [Actinomycetota bacterium]
WRAKTGKERAAIMRRWFDLINRDADRLAKLMTEEQGKALLEAKGEVIYAASFIEWFAEEAKRVMGAVPASPWSDKRLMVLKQPIGVCVSITPWNFPLAMITRKVAPAIAAGCTIVIKPAEQTPLSALALGELAKEAGIPDGVINIVTADAANSVAIGQALCAAPAVRHLSFTGSTPVGRILMEQCAPTIKKVALELGGHAPFIVFEDADLDLAAEIAVEQYDNAGQVCLSGTRIFVHENVADEFAKKFGEKAAAIKQGDPRDESTDIGPQIHQVHFDRVKGFVDRAKAEGQEIVWGGEPNDELGGLFFKPTLVKNPTEGSEIVTSEIFGPVLCMMTFKTDEEVIERANGTEFGLAAVVVSGNQEHAKKITDVLVAGTIWVNCFFVRDLRAPFGGSKKSGIGRDGGTWSFDFYADVKNTVVSPNGWKE